MINDKHAAAGHEAGHAVLARHLGAPWQAAWLWRGQQRWDGLCRHAPIDRSLVPLVAVAGAAAEGMLHGYRHPSDMTQFLGAEDAAAGAKMEGGFEYARYILSGQRRAEWAADTGLLRRELRLGEWSRSSPPSEWIAADEASSILIQGQNQMPTTADAVTTLCTFLRDEAGLDEEQMSRVGVMLEAVSAEAMGVPAASISMDRAMRPRPMGQTGDRAYDARFPDSGRLTSSASHQVLRTAR